ncbi:MAG TPA: dipeptide ABC transporter ATP-binding protein [Rhodocyclaceae bacterium]|nr:dipeptide ABC transporter ATP-binding protein [Rhodocyclaceae bacterium]
MSLLSVKDLSVQIGAGKPVDAVSFEIKPGQTFALLGESGCGKSMTALAIMRLLPPAARVQGGLVDYAKQNLLDLPEVEMRRVRGGGIGMIFQEPATSLNPVMTIGQQIGEVLALHCGLRNGSARQRALELLESVGLPDAERRLDEYPFQLSGGMKQRAMIAMALAGDPELLIADEPTTALDVTIQAQVLDLLKKLQQERGMGILLITHDLGVVERMADHVGVMYAGQLIEVAPRDQFFANPAHPYSQKLFASLPERAGRGQRLETIPGMVPPLDTQHTGCRFTPRCASAMSHCKTIEPAWYSIHGKQQVRCHLFDPQQVGMNTVIKAAPPKPAAEIARVQTNTLLQVCDLKVHFPIQKGLLQRTVGHVRAVDGVSFALPAGRTLALVGESGCGKTTVGKAILQLLQPSSGSVQLAGQELTGLSAHALRPLRAQAQMVFQDPFSSLNPRMRVGAIIAEGMQALGQKLSKQDVEARIAELLGQVGLRADMATRYPHEFSGGQRQRIAIARALAVNPKLLICDEPTSALDVSVQAQIVNLLHDLQDKLGLAYLFITHNMAVVDYLADDVAVMYKGKIVEHGSADDVLSRPQNAYTQELLAAAFTRMRGAAA